MDATDDINNLTSQSILAEDVFAAIFDEEDPVFQARMVLTLQDKAKSLGVKTKFETLLKSYRKVYKEAQERKEASTFVNHMTNYTFPEGSPYSQMYCQNWIASDKGITYDTANINSSGVPIVACSHPILPLQRLKNLETGDEQIKLAYKRNGFWAETIVPKTTIASANKIVNLSGQGIAVTSETAKYLVRYLYDVECSNEDIIDVQKSSSKVGWVDGMFLPYDKGVVFDGETRFRQLYESITTGGDRETWYNHVKEIRASGRLEPKLMLAASFSSVLVKLLGVLPFIVDLWGDTEGGKTVTLMLAASVWANPAENAYVGDFQSTDVALEAKADMLNSLPLILDDTSKVSKNWENMFEKIVYNLCSGKGKSRSNKEIGVNKESHWLNCTLTNGEKPLSEYVNQGGAINRIIEIQAPEKIFNDPQYTAEVVKKNFGWAGIDFINVLKTLDQDDLRNLARAIQRHLEDEKTMQKQAISLSVILLADQMVTEYLFKDDNGIDLEQAKELLTDKSFVSENERAYQFIQDTVVMNPARFAGEANMYDKNIEQWGFVELTDDGGRRAVITNKAFHQIMKEGGFSVTGFLNWADRKGLIEKDTKGRRTRPRRIDGVLIRCVFLLLSQEEEELEPIDEDPVFD